MLSPDDQRLVERELALPGLPTLLSDEAMTDAYARAWPALGVRSVHANYLRYKPKTSCIVGYAIVTDSGTHSSYARAHRTPNAEKLHLHADEALVLPGAASIVFRPGYDAELPGFRRLAAADDEGLFEKLTHHGRAGQELHSLAYKPERRWVARVGDATWPLGVIKCYEKAFFAHLRPQARRFQSTGSLRVPRRRGKSSRFAAMMLEWLDGRPLRSTDRLGSDECERIARALAKLHAQHVQGLAPLTADVLEARVSSVRDLIAAIAPSQALRAADLATRLNARLRAQPQEPAEQVSLHGDFYADQVLLLADGRIGLIDLDEAAVGDAAADFGNFVAHAATAGDDSAIDAMIDSLRRGYAASPAGLPAPAPDAIRFFASVACFQLATRAFRRHEFAWDQSIGRLLDLSDGLLEGCPPRGGIAPPRAGSMNVAVDDPYSAAADAKLGAFLEVALDPARIAPLMAPLIRPLVGNAATLRHIRVCRLKPHRRCLLQYEFAASGTPDAPDAPHTLSPFTIIAKIRAKGADASSFAALEMIHRAGFASDSADGVSVPRPIGIIPALGMTLHAKVPGRLASELLVGSGGIGLTRRIAQALVKLHRVDGVSPKKRHTIDDEMRILHERLSQVGTARPELAARLEALGAACDELALTLSTRSDVVGIHRDFYPDQVLVDQDRIYLLDFDLFCLGDPALDAGNFIAHLSEQALRTLNDATALAAHERAFKDEFCALHGESIRPAVRAYALLSLARHVWVSHNIPARQPWTEAILALCEQRLASPLAVG